MKRIAQYGLGILFLVLVIQVVILAPKTVEEANVHETGVKPEVGQQVDQAMHGVHLLETNESGKEWELWADEALSFRSLDQWSLKTVKAVFFGKNGVYFTVTGKKGRVETKTKNMHVEGNVITRSSNGYVFRSESMDYDSNTRQLRSPTKVVMNGPVDKQGSGLALKGHEMHMDLTTSLMVVEGQVQAQKALGDKRLLHIRSHSSQFSGKSKLARFLGNVVMDIETMRITGPEAEFAYDANQEIVTSVLVKGGVKVSDLDKWATSDRLQVNFVDDSYVFEGKPRMVQNNDELVGEKIYFFEGGKRVKVESARARMDQKRLGGAGSSTNLE
jgi:LPS export ABC transporter protein LptC